MATQKTHEAIRLAHSCKSLAGSLGALVLSEAARQLEQTLGQTPLPKPQFAQEFAHFRTSLHTLLASLEKLPAEPAVDPATEDAQHIPVFFRDLAMDLKAANASSETRFAQLSAALKQAATVESDYEKMLGEIKDLIEDVEYEQALKRLELLQEQWKKNLQ
jgi:HPt (histidine-containing phosphotransfer) domain-containing protein